MLISNSNIHLGQANCICTCVLNTQGIHEYHGSNWAVEYKCFPLQFMRRLEAIRLSDDGAIGSHGSLRQIANVILLLPPWPCIEGLQRN